VSAILGMRNMSWDLGGGGQSAKDIDGSLINFLFARSEAGWRDREHVVSHVCNFRLQNMFWKSNDGGERIQNMRGQEFRFLFLRGEADTISIFFLIFRK
jgi:hypothetical protein